VVNYHAGGRTSGGQAIVLIVELVGYGPTFEPYAGENAIE